jgi:hypothetical protein
MRQLSGVGKIEPKWQSDPARHKEMPQVMIVTHSFVNQKRRSLSDRPLCYLRVC